MNIRNVGNRISKKSAYLHAFVKLCTTFGRPGNNI